MADQTSLAPQDVVRKGIDAINRHDLDTFVTVYAPDAVVYDSMHPEPLRGSAAIRKDMEDFFRAFPDLQAKMSNFLHDGERLAFEVTMSGTHKGDMESPEGPIAATGRRMEMPTSLFSRLDAQSRIVEERRYYNVASLMQQLGLT
jgi:steroid delta-isomerase-like uncharacterized protein